MSNLAVQQKTTAVAGFDSADGYALLSRIANQFACSDIVPKVFHGKVSNCIIALDMANRMGAAPLMVMQNMYIVHGTPSFSSKFLIATFNGCGRFSPIRYEWRGKAGDADYGCRAWTTEKGSEEKLSSIWVDWKLVRAEKWDTKDGSKWKTMPDLMFQYRAAAFLIRTVAPELSMGLQTVEEVTDVYDASPSADGVYTITPEQEPQELPPYPKVQFEANKGEWEKLIKKGKSPDVIIDKIETVSKLTEEQKQAIRDMAKPDKADEVKDAEVIE